ncbi:MAG: fatty acid desaturase [Candidatus Hydrogenedentes bacterium]|nr:fatty acid desaturase [Candidatus Hydrogenedentota bacterium]
MEKVSAYIGRRKLKISTIVGIAALHAGLVLAPFTFTWSGLIVCLVLVFVTGALGITVCWHRLLTHRSFKTPKLVEYILTGCGCLALQGGPISWVAAHRLHHKEADLPPDPHTPLVNFLWSHVGWLFFTDPQLDTYDKLRRWAKDLDRDRVIRFFQKSCVPLYFAVAGALFLVGFLIGGWKFGLSLVVWGSIVRTVYVWHVTWLVNSATHLWGYRNYPTKDNSRNTWWVALLTFGEGWHNNHHAVQHSAAHGHRWFEFDVTYLTIRAMELLGLASHVVRPNNLARMQDAA